MISLSKNFLFIHRGKSGGNSITKQILPYCEDEKIITSQSFQDGIHYFDVNNIRFGTRKHASIQEIKDSIPLELFQSLYKFTVVRNPFERLISAYYSPNRVLKKNIKSFDENSFLSMIERQRTLRDFVCLSESDQLDTHIDFYVRFENIQEDINKLFLQLGIPEGQLPHLNSSKREHYSKYYTTRLISKVEERFSEEIDFFKYRFETI